MASATLKYSAVIITSLITGGVAAIIGAPLFSAAAVQTAPAAEARSVLFWYDPMKPDVRFDKPGKSPFMDMDLVPKYADEGDGGDSAGVRIDPVQQQNLGMKTERVRRGVLSYRRTFPANVMFNDYQFVIVQARAAGFIEKISPLTVGDRVRKGTALAEITVPEWVEAQSEYLLLRETGGTAVQLRGVLERLRLAGMPEPHIRQLQQKRQIQTRFVITAPINGVLTAFDMKTGMNIAKENTIARIQGIDPIWLTAAVPESLAYLLRGNDTQLSLSVPARPDKTFTITRHELLPEADPVSRTLQLRLQVANPEELLKPGMNAYLTLTAQSGEMMLIPSRAVIDTGSEQRVITLDDEGRFVPKKITVLRESQGETGIGNELQENEQVVVNGLFLIDSEASISGALDRMRGSTVPDGEHAGHQGGGHD